jgi:hypothetical protein
MGGLMRGSKLLKKLRESVVVLDEAATTKSRAQAMLRDVDALLADKSISDDLRNSLTGMRTALKKKWSDLTPAPAVEESDRGDATDVVVRVLTEAAAILPEDESHESKRCRLQAAVIGYYKALEAQTAADQGTDYYYDYGSSSWPWISAVFDDAVVVRYKGQYVRFDYTVTDETVTVENPTLVRIAYVEDAGTDPSADTVEEKVKLTDATSSRAIEGRLVPLLEAKTARDGTIPVKLIEPGWGSTGYYSEAMLKRDGPKIFKKGTHSYWNHPSVSEADDRPERDLWDLAGVLVEDAYWSDTGVNNHGKGLYGNLKVFSNYAQPVEELAEHIGISIRAMGVTTLGSAEGQTGEIVESLVDSPITSTDFVTKPGAGGKVAKLYEAVRVRGHKVEKDSPEEEGEGDEEEEDGMTPEEIKKLVSESVAEQVKEARAEASEAKQESARLRESLILREAKDIIREELSRFDIHDMTRTRLTESLVNKAPIKDGTLDREALSKLVEEAAAAEVEYIAKTTGVGDGKIRNVTEARRPADEEEFSEEDFSKELEESFRDIGWGENGAKLAAAGRSQR